MGNTGVMRFGGCNLSGAVDHEGTMLRERDRRQTSTGVAAKGMKNCRWRNVSQR
jgi:hypothetical protein